MKSIQAKTLLTAIALAVSALGAEAQMMLSTKNKGAIKLYQEAQMTNSPGTRRALLEKAIKRDKKFIEAYRLLARDYARMDSLQKAVEVLQPACNPEYPGYCDVLLNMADYYYMSGQYEEAIATAEQITAGHLLSKKAELIEQYQTAIEMKNSPYEISPRNLKNVNTPFDDYFPSVTADGHMLSTTVLVPTENEYGMVRRQEDIYVSYKSGDDWGKSERLPYPMNTSGNEGAQSFSTDGRYMFFVSCDNMENIGSCDMYYAIRQGNGWSKPMNLGAPANSKYWESNPVMSPTGDKIYFTSNRPGGVGDRDLWSVDVRILDNGLLHCSNAQNLGRPVNSEGGEFSPFIHADNQTLYFSSNGHGGMGRNDIFVSKRVNGEWGEPVNLGYPINTHGDESGFTVSGDGRKAYFASDKIEDNDMKLEIYEIDLPGEFRPQPMSFVQGHVIDAKKNTPLQSMVEIFNLQTNEKYFESITDRKDGTFTVYLPEEGEYGLSVDKDGYLFYSRNIDQSTDTLIVMLQPITAGSGFVLRNMYYGYDSDVILESSWVEIERLYEFLKDKPALRIKIVGHTDSRGSSQYNKDLSERRALALKNKLIEKGISADRLEHEGMGDTRPVAPNDTEENRAKNRRVEIVIIE